MLEYDSVFYTEWTDIKNKHFPHNVDIYTIRSKEKLSERKRFFIFCNKMVVNKYIIAYLSLDINVLNKVKMLYCLSHFTGFHN